MEVVMGQLLSLRIPVGCAWVGKVYGEWKPPLSVFDDHPNIDME